MSDTEGRWVRTVIAVDDAGAPIEVQWDFVPAEPAGQGESQDDQ